MIYADARRTKDGLYVLEFSEASAELGVKPGSTFSQEGPPERGGLSGFFPDKESAISAFRLTGHSLADEA